MAVKKPGATPDQVRKKKVRLPRSKQQRLDKAQESLRKYHDAKVAVEEASNAAAEAEAVLLEVLQRTGIKTVVFVDDDTGIRVQGTLTEPERSTTDPDALRKDVGARVWNKITRKVLDKDKLKTAIASGDVDPVVVAKHTTTSKTKPFIKVTEKQVEK